MPDIITRASWGARAPRAVSRVDRTRGVKIHYTGSPESPAMRREHGRCVDRVRDIQAAHMDAPPDGRGWSDIAYNLVVCIHGRILMGRGPGVLTAANGAGLNAGHYSICALVGTKGVVDPSPAMIRGLCQAIEYLRAEGGAGPEVKGHRDGYPTDCPGDRLYAWVKDGAPCPDDQEGDEVPGYVSVTTSKLVPLPADEWTTIRWDREASDRDHQHADAGGPSVLNGPAVYGLTADLALTGMPAGADLQVRAIEVLGEDPGDAHRGGIGEYRATNGTTYVHHNVAADKVEEGRRVRLQVKPIGHPATLTDASCKVKFWR